MLSKIVPMTHEEGASWLEVIVQALGNNRNLFKFFNGAERENETIPLLEVVNQIIWQGELLGSDVVGMIMQ